MHAPVLDLGKSGAETQHLVLDKERHHLRQPHRVFLTVGEAGHGLSLDEQLAVRGPDMARRGRMANHGERLARADQGFQQPDRVLVFGKVPPRSVAAGIEHRVVVVLLDAFEA